MTDSVRGSRQKGRESSATRVSGQLTACFPSVERVQKTYGDQSQGNGVHTRSRASDFRSLKILPEKTRGLQAIVFTGVPRAFVAISSGSQVGRRAGLKSTWCLSVW